MITPAKDSIIPNILLHRIISFRKMTDSMVEIGIPSCRTIATEETYLELSKAR